MVLAIGHEKLNVYQKGLEYISWSHSIISAIGHTAIVVDHWNRAAESIVENIANGNSRRSRKDRNRYFNTAVGSALECAACLDICNCRNMLSDEEFNKGKKMLQSIVRMTVKLRGSESRYIKENKNDYHIKEYFPHESLDVYRTALELIVWHDEFVRTHKISSDYGTRLDKSTTSIVLNIAEGNGRFSDAEQMRFLNIAYSCVMRTSVCLDILTTKYGVKTVKGKGILTRIIPLIIGLRKHLED